MQTSYPSPEEAGIRVPPHVKPERFRAGFRHALKGGQLNRIEYMRLSFREGFRAAKLYLRELRRSQGILDYPVCWKVRMR
jgi:hypothetical protein